MKLWEHRENIELWEHRENPKLDYVGCGPPPWVAMERDWLPDRS